MASIQLQNVTLDYPIYGSKPTFRAALKQVTGGLIRREGLKLDRVTVRALDDITLTLKDGDRLGLIGHNGAGKSTLLRVCAGIYEPTGGDITIQGQVCPLFNASPGIDGDDTGYENIVTCGLYLGMTREEIARKTPEIEKCSELGEYLALPVRSYSTGMLVRLAFALATSMDPEILILDEGLGAGDARFTERTLGRVDALVARCKILVLASHSMELLRQMCNTAVLMHAGRICASGTVDEVAKIYRDVCG